MVNGPQEFLIGLQVDLFNFGCLPLELDELILNSASISQLFTITFCEESFCFFFFFFV